MDEITKIIGEFQNNDHSHFEKFYEMTKRQVFYSALSILKDHSSAEDIMQETYMSFLKTVNEFKLGNNVYSYLSIIARNMAINLYNKQKYVAKDDEVLAYIGSEDDSPVDDVDRILNLLDEDVEREIVIYHVINEYKFQEIAKIINKPLGTVLWIYNKAIKKLKERIGSVL